ncbi:MAG: mechanosensitive ion channel family protein [Planctomycetota bacterium]|jgi:small conductance mechanosensitive channel
MNRFVRTCLMSLSLVAVALLAPTPLVGQEARTASKPEVSVDDLALMLKPLRKDQVLVEAEAWMKLLQDKVQAITDKELEARDPERAADSARLREEASGLRDQRAQLVDRTLVVLDALAAKGGAADKVKELQQYVNAVQGLELDVRDAGAIWTTIVGWLQSPEGGLRYGKNILLFLITLLIFQILGKIVGRLIRGSLGRFKNTSDLLKDFLANSARKLTLFIGIIVALSMLEVNIGAFLAAIGAAGFVVGFALQGTLSNFASGLMILLYRPYDIGDFVSVADATGTVAAMTLVSTTVKTPDNMLVVVPNSSIWGGTITNVTGSDTRRVDLVFGIGYDDDIQKAQAILEDVVSKQELVLAEPAPVVKLHELADSSVNFVVRPWSRTGDYWNVYWDITRQVKERFDAEGVSIPFPQQDIYIKEAPATAS